MTRLDLDPNNFAVQVKQLRADLDQIKGAQRTGKDIWKPHIIEALDGAGNPTVYDLIANVPDGSGGLQTRNFIATMTADHQDQVFAIPVYRVYYGAPGTLPASSNNVVGNSYLEFSVNQLKKIAYSGRFGDNVFPYSTVTYLKVYFYATDTGTLQVVGNP